MRDGRRSCGPPQGQHCRPLGLPPGTGEARQPPVDPCDPPTLGCLLPARRRPHNPPVPWHPSLPPGLGPLGGPPLLSRRGVIIGRSCQAWRGLDLGALGLRLVYLDWTPPSLLHVEQARRRPRACHVSAPQAASRGQPPEEPLSPGYVRGCLLRAHSEGPHRASPARTQALPDQPLHLAMEWPPGRLHAVLRRVVAGVPRRRSKRRLRGMPSWQSARTPPVFLHRGRNTNRSGASLK